MGKTAYRKAPKRMADRMTQEGPNAGKAAEFATTQSPLSSMLKEQLRSKIQRERLSGGLEELSVDFTPKPAQPLTKAEKEQEKRRKECNRKSANLSRIRAKKERELNAKSLKEEQSKKEYLTKDVCDKTQEKSKLLHILINRFGLSLDTIQQTLSTITCENKLLEATDNGLDEDRESVYYLQHLEHNDTNSETNDSTEQTDNNPQTNEESGSVHHEIVSGNDVISGSGEITGSDEIAGSYATNEEWDAASTGSSQSMEFQIIEGGEYGETYDENEDDVTLIVFVEQPVPEDPTQPEVATPEVVSPEDESTSAEGPIYTNL